MSRRPRDWGGKNCWDSTFEKRTRTEETEQREETTGECMDLAEREEGVEDIEDAEREKSATGRPRCRLTPSWSPRPPFGTERIIKGYLSPRGRGRKPREPVNPVVQGAVVEVRREEVVRIERASSGTREIPEVERVNVEGRRDWRIIIGLSLFLIGAGAGWMMRGLVPVLVTCRCQ